MNGVSLQITQGSNCDSQPSQDSQRKESAQSEKGHESSSDSEVKDDTHHEWPAMVSNGSYCLINVLEVMKLCQMESYKRVKTGPMDFIHLLSLNINENFSVYCRDLKLPFSSSLVLLLLKLINSFISKSKHKID